MGGKQLSFADALSDPRLGTNRRLEAIGAAIDWAPLAALAARLRPGRTGRPPYEPLVMLKALLLQRLYALSDPQLEEALFDRLSFRRFCGFAAGEGAPDETTLCRFRQDAAESGVLEACLDEVNRQLAAKGLMLKTGTLIDATIIAAKSRKPEPAAGLGAQVPSEPDADWTKKNGRSHFGYRLHAGVDEGSGLIRRLGLPPARVNESLVADDLICGDERAVYGDKGYESKARRARLKARGIGSGRGEGGGAAQVGDDREGDHVAGVAGKRRAAGAGEPVQALQGPEDALDGGAAAGDEGVAPRLPARQGGLVLVRAVHDAILDAARLEPGAALLALVALVAIDGALVAADEVVGDEALVHSGRGQHEPADQARALVDAGMEAIAEMGAAVLLRPVGVGLGRN